MSTTTSGIFNSRHFTKDLDEKSFSSMITRLMPNGTAPLFSLSSQLKVSTAVNIEHGFFTKTMVFPSIELSADITASDTVLNVVSTENIIQNQVLQFQATGENVLVNQVLSPTQIAVTRGIGGGAALIDISTMAPEAHQVGTAFEEASIRPNALAVNPVRITNLTQIFRNTWAVSGTAEQIKVIAGDTTVAENKQDAAQFHATDIETAILFGKKSMGTRNGMPFRTMDGLINIVSNPLYYPPSYGGNVNVYDALSTGTNALMLEDALDPVFDQTTDPSVGNSRILFVGGTANRVLNHIGRLNGDYSLVDGQTNWGLRFKTLTMSRGTFDIIEHPLFNTNQYWKKMAVAVDISSFGLAYLGNRKTVDKPFGGNKVGNDPAVDNGIDAVGGTLTTEVTCEVRNPPANAVIYNLTKALTDPLAPTP